MNERARRAEGEGALRAIVVDDEPLARDELAFLLRECGEVEVVGEAEDAHGALALCEAHPVDVAFVDLRMPGPDGIALASALRARHAGLKVVVVSAHDEGAARAFDAAVADYLLKPVRLERLRSAVARLRAALAGPPVAQALTGEGEPSLASTSTSTSTASSTGVAPRESLTRIAVRRRDSYIVLEVADVLYFEVRDELVWAVTREERYAVDRTLATLEDLLAETFFRSHRAVLVRLDAIRKIEPVGQGKYDLVLHHASELRVPLARERVKSLRERIPFAG